MRVASAAANAHVWLNPGFNCGLWVNRTDLSGQVGVSSASASMYGPTVSRCSIYVPWPGCERRVSQLAGVRASERPMMISTDVHPDSVFR
jgi:hypothetical protein